MPDLDVQDTGEFYPPYLSASSVIAGTSVIFTYRLSNWGPDGAPSSVTGIYRSTNSSISTSDTPIGYDPNAALSANTGLTDTFTIDTTGWAPGTYYIGGVADFANAITEGNESNNASSGVVLTVTAAGTTDAGSTLATATALTLGGTVSQSVGIGTDTDDFFKFTATASGRVTANLTGLSADIDLRALNSAGTQVAVSEAAGTSNEFVGFNVVAGQTYYLRVDPYGAVSSNYSLGTSFAAASAAEITVIGNGVSIADGDTTPTTTDFTNFGSATLGGAGVIRTFTVRNDGSATLTLGSVVLPAGFTLVNALQTSLAPGASDTFQVRMDAATVGTRTGQISFTSNDSNESPFNFSITGTVVAATSDNAGNTLATATALGLGTTTSGSVGVGADTDDFFKFTATASGRVTANLTGLSADIDLRALNSAGTQVAVSEAAGTSNEFVGFNVVAGQTYYLRVDPYGAVSSNYSLGTSFAAASAAEITVIGNGVSIADGDTTPTTTDFTNFGSATLGGAGVIRTFTVRNDGSATLTLGSVVLPAGFTLVNALQTSLAPGASDTFQVRMDAATVGTRTGQISFTSNDSNESPFNFSITGTVVAATSDNAGNTLATATALGLGTTTSGSVGVGADTDDFFKFTATASGRVTVKLAGLSADVDARALNSSGTAIDASEAGGTANEFLSFTVVAGQTYYVQVEPYGAVSSSYSLATSFTTAVLPLAASAFRMPFTNLTRTQEYGTAGELSNLPTYKHLGEDFGGAEGSSILAAANGKVIAAVNSSPTTGFGNYVVIQHTLPDQSKIYSLYGHMSYVNAKVGDTVSAGEQIGIIGATGVAHGRHLHFEISTINKFTQAGMFGGGYDSPDEWTTSSHYTVDPSDFVSGAIFGNASANKLTGSAANNFLFGGLGNDNLTGGSGRDTFAFTTALGATNVDALVDFSVADDTIWLNREVFTSAGAIGRLSTGAFRVGTAAADADDRIIYNSTTGALTYDSNGDAVGGAVQFATLGTGLSLTVFDFYLY